MLKPNNFLIYRLLMFCVTPGLDRPPVLFFMIYNLVMGLQIFGTG